MRTLVWQDCFVQGTIALPLAPPLSSLIIWGPHITTASTSTYFTCLQLAFRTYHSHQTSPNSAPMNILPLRQFRCDFLLFAPMRCAKSPILVAEGYARRPLSSPGWKSPWSCVTLRLMSRSHKTRCKQRQRSTWAVEIFDLLVGSDGPMIISWNTNMHPAEPAELASTFQQEDCSYYLGK